MPSDRLSINGEPYDIVDQSKIKTSRRNYIETIRPSQPFETEPLVVSWAPWGPIGNSRARYPGPLATDYADNLDHRYDYLLTSTAKRNAVSLTSITNTWNLEPDSDVQKTNWSEGAGDADGDAFDELSVANEVAGYWTTSTNDAEIIVGLGDPTETPVDVQSVTVLAQVNEADNCTVRIRLLETTTEIHNSTVAFTNAGGWLNVTVTLSASEIAAINDWTALRVAVSRTDESGAFNLSYIRLQYAEPATVLTIDEQDSALFFARGTYVTQVNPVDMTESVNNNFSFIVTDTVASWQNAGFVSFGQASNVRKRTAVTTGSASYSTVSSVNAYKMAVGPERLWIIDAGGGADDGKAKYAFADLTSANLSNAFQISDPGQPVTGLYTNDVYAMVGHERGVNSFTASGKPSRLLEATKEFPSPANAARGDTLWGWTYVATRLGLYAIDIERKIANPVGPGEGLRGQGFEGPIDGYPTAVRAFKDSLWVSYLNTDGTSYVFRGTYGTETADSGRPEWFSFRKLSSLQCTAIGATGKRTAGATLVVAEDNDFAYYDLSLRGREIEDSNYSFDTGGGSWFGTTLMMPIGVQGYVRWAKVFTENCVASTDTWTVAVDVDDADSYINIGSAITANGAQTVRPTSGSPASPLSTVAFTSLKPRLTQVASSESAPPQIRGELAIGIDARPEHVKEIDVLIDLDKPSDLATLQALIGDDQIVPVKITLPSDTDVNPNTYGHVVTAEWYDRTDPTDTVAMVKIRMWEIT